MHYAMAFANALAEPYMSRVLPPNNDGSMRRHQALKSHSALMWPTLLSRMPIQQPFRHGQFAR